VLDAYAKRFCSVISRFGSGVHWSIMQAEYAIRNGNLRVLLGKTSGQVSRILKRLRKHSLIKKAANSYKYYLTSLGRQVVATSLKLKELFIIPNLRGKMDFARQF
jgi:DNA-binding MarR family transcriptional regulator